MYYEYLLVTANFRIMNSYANSVSLEIILKSAYPCKPTQKEIVLFLASMMYSLRRQKHDLKAKIKNQK